MRLTERHLVAIETYCKTDKSIHTLVESYREQRIKLAEQTMFIETLRGRIAQLEDEIMLAHRETRLVQSKLGRRIKELEKEIEGYSLINKKGEP